MNYLILPLRIEALEYLVNVVNIIKVNMHKRENFKKKKKPKQYLSIKHAFPHSY